MYCQRLLTDSDRSFKGRRGKVSEDPDLAGFCLMTPASNYLAHYGT